MLLARMAQSNWLKSPSYCRGSCRWLSNTIPPVCDAFDDEVLGLTWNVLIAPIGFLLLVSFAMCVLTGSVRLLPIAAVWNLIFAAAGFGLVYVSLRVCNALNTSHELVQWPILESMLSLSIASWIVWRQRSNMYR